MEQCKARHTAAYQQAVKKTVANLLYRPPVMIQPGPKSGDHHLRVNLPPRPQPRSQPLRIIAPDPRLEEKVSQFLETQSLNLPAADSRVDAAESHAFWSNFLARQPVTAPVNSVEHVSVPVSIAPAHGQTAGVPSCPFVAGPGPQITAASPVYAPLASSVG